MRITAMCWRVTSDLMVHKVNVRSVVAAVCILANICIAGGLPEPNIPNCCGVQLKTHNFTTETLDQVHRLGFCVVRRGFYWKSVESERGVYDFSDYDKQMQHARQLGLTVIACIFGGNKLYEDDGRGGIQTEAGRRGFAGFAAAAARRYKGHKVLWEIWNEPNVRTFWRKNGKHNSDEFADEYTALVKTVVPAMLGADSDCFIMAGSVSNYWQPSYEWTESCFRKGILKTGICGWSVHPYGVKTPEEFAVGHERTRELLRQYGKPNLPMLNTERGFAVKETVEGWSGGSRQRAREFQGWHLVRQLLVDQMHGVGLTIWYEWDGGHFGLIGQGDSSPALKAWQVMCKHLGGYHFSRRLESDSKLDYVVVFENGVGDRKLVAWTSPPPQAAPDEAKTHEVAIDVLKSPSFSVVSHTGDVRETMLSIGSIQLELSGAPQYIAIPRDVQLGRCRSLVARGVSQHKTPTQPAAGNTAGVPTTPPEPVVGDLGLFDGDPTWTFQKNTGQGSFSIGADQSGTAIGIIEYDFTRSTSRSTPYVLATAPVNITEGTAAVVINARSPIAQQLTFRLIDSTGQTHQYKKRIKGAGQWEIIRIPMARKLEHWGGAKDGVKHFPLKQIVFSVPLPGADVKTGKVEYANVAVE